MRSVWETEFEMALELKSQQREPILHLCTKPGRHLITELERRQATILSRIASLPDSVYSQTESVMAEAPIESAAARELKQQNQQQISNPWRSSRTDLAELENRQTAILRRIVGLFGSVDSLKCELIGMPDPCHNAGDGVQSSFSSRRCGEGPRHENRGGEIVEEDSKEVGKKVLRNKYGAICPTRIDRIGESTGEGERGQCGDGGHEQGVDVEARLTRILSEAGADFLFKRVPSDYYGRSFVERRDLLGAASVDHLCKSIVMVNTQALESVTDCTDRNNSKYYVIVVQYTARLNAEKVKHFVHSLNNGQISKKRFNLRLAPEEESNRLTGFEHNAVTPFGMLTNIPVILSDAIVKLEPRFFWLGGGEVDLKLGIRTNDFVKLINPFVVDSIY